MYYKILQNDGLIISEYPPDEKTKSQHFLDRNRIVSGLSLGVLVIEAAYRSGTSVTANLAKEQNKKVFALPHEIWDSHGVGTNKLIKNGAILVTCIDDILDILKLEEFKAEHESIKESIACLNTNTKNVNSRSNKSNNLPTAITEDFENNISNNPTSSHSYFNNSTNTSKTKKTLENSEFENIYTFINYSPVSVNELTKKTNLPVNTIMQGLFMLELDGYIKKISGGYICI